MPSMFQLTLNFVYRFEFWRNSKIRSSELSRVKQSIIRHPTQLDLFFFFFFSSTMNIAKLLFENFVPRFRNFVLQLQSQLSYTINTMCISKNRASFYLWQKEDFVKHWKGSKYQNLWWKEYHLGFKEGFGKCLKILWKWL